MTLQSLLASEIASLCGSTLIGRDRTISRVCTLDAPRANALGFARKLRPEQAERIAAIETCVFLVTENLANNFPGAHIPMRDPRFGFAKTVSHMRMVVDEIPIHPSAVIHASAHIGTNVRIGANVSIGKGSQIGDGTIIHPGVVIGPSVVIGSNGTIKSCTVIGQEGFGIAQDKDGNNFRLPHIGGVVIGSNVELGALNTVCSGTIEPTVVEDFVKTDDHVHIAHNVRVGANCILTACAEISGSVDIGARTWLGPNCSIINGIVIGRGVFVGIGAVVTKPLPDRAVVAGNPARVLRIAERDAIPLPPGH